MGKRNIELKLAGGPVGMADGAVAEKCSHGKSIVCEQFYTVYLV